MYNNSLAMTSTLVEKRLKVKNIYLPHCTKLSLTVSFFFVS